MKTEIDGTTLELVRGDIAVQDVDAVVNAANRALRSGGGVDAAIRRAGGPQITEETNRIGGCEPRGAVITTGGDLPARHVIHAVGPIWRGGGEGERDVLAEAYRSSLHVALEHDLRSVAFPSVSTGTYGYPVRQAARVALEAVVGFLRNHPGELDLVRFVLFSQEDLQDYCAVLEEMLSE